MVFIVAIDGPAGSGKSSVAKAVARDMGLSYVDTGAIYRTLAYAALKKGIPLDDAEALAKLAQSLPIELKPTTTGQKVFLQDIDISKSIRSENISKTSSMVSRYAEVRSSLLELQRRLGREATMGAVLEGRDIGTVVFPDADMKFFLTASDEQRAERRFLELKDQGEDVAYESVLAQIKERDGRDKHRDVAPLIPAADAILIDTTRYSKQEVIQLIETQIKGKLAKNSLKENK